MGIELEVTEDALTRRRTWSVSVDTRELEKVGDGLPPEIKSVMMEGLRHLGRKDAPLHQKLQGLSVLLCELSEIERLGGCQDP